jgi:hypothetical protein
MLYPSRILTAYFSRSTYVFSRSPSGCGGATRGFGPSGTRVWHGEGPDGGAGVPEEDLTPEQVHEGQGNGLALPSSTALPLPGGQVSLLCSSIPPRILTF